MTCIIHYENCDYYDEPSQISDKTADRILLAKSLHEKFKDEHVEQCKSIPTEELTKYSIHFKPCYKKFVRITEKEKCEKQSSATITTRSTRKSTTKLEELSFAPRKKKAQVQTRHSRRGSSTLATEDSRNKFVFGKNCVLCDKFELRYKNKSRQEIREQPRTLTLDITAANIKEQLMKKPGYEAVAEKIILVSDLIAAEFKYHDKCKRDLMEEESDSSIVGRPNESNEKVLAHIESHVVAMNQVVSMNVLYDICHGNSNDAGKDAVIKRKQRLKAVIKERYGDSILIIGTKANHPEVIISSKNVDSKMSLNSYEKSIIQNAARCLRRDILEYCSSLPEMSWPPTLEELLSENRLPPPSTVLFLTTLLKSPKHSVTERIRRLIESFSADLMYGVSGEHTGKHYLLGHGLHSMTGNKETVQITNRLGHCITYDKVLEIETAQAQKAVKLMNSSDTSILPLRPQYPMQTVTTVFWADNLDMKVELETGGGAINMTTIMAFQEESIGAVPDYRTVSVPKTKSRNVSVNFEKHNILFCSKQEPNMNFEAVETDLNSVFEFSITYFTWLYLRYSNRLGQIHPNLSGMLLRLRQKEYSSQSLKISKTVESYLPPLPTKVTDPETIYSYFKYFQKLAEEMNMPYVNITLDVGAAINAYKLLWKYSEEFANVVIHLGDFHIMKENFKVMGLLLECSGFEDIVYQGRLCTSGSLCGVLNGTHYNRAWKIHEVMAEALERILFKRFLHEIVPEISADLKELASEECDMISNHSMKLGADLQKQFSDYQEKVRQGHLGKTAQFWLIYADMMRVQQQHHTSVQENNYDLRILSIEAFIPYYFYYNMQNYARYASYYVQVLKCIEKTHPGLKDLLASSGLSVQSQNRYPLRTAIDMRGEQTLNRDAKTSGGITYFSASASSVQKWAMNRSDAAQSKGALRAMAGLSDPNTIYKSLRPLQILTVERKVSNVTDVIENDYINPFGLQVDEKSLLNIGSGVAVKRELADDIVQQKNKGTELAQKFKEDRLFNSKIKFHQAISKNNNKRFKDSMKSCVLMNKSGGHTTVEVNRNILGALNSFSVNTGIAVDYKKALAYPLNPCPLSICHADGRKRKNVKSDLKDQILGEDEILSSNEIQLKPKDAVVVDMMGVVNLITSVPDTYEELSLVFLAKLPKGYRRIDIVADSYTSVKLYKNGVVGDQANKILIPSLKSRVHPEYANVILKNRENKSRLVELIFEYIETNAIKCFEVLHSEVIVLSSQENCIKIVSSDGCASIEQCLDLKSNHDEGDTKVVLHASKILKEDPLAFVTVRSPSGDTDIVVLLIFHLFENAQRVILDDFHGEGKRKHYLLSDLTIEKDMVDALIGFHAFTGNDFVSSFFRKGKKTCFKLLESSSYFKAVFSKLGEDWSLSDDLYEDLQSFVLKLYSMAKALDVNDARYRLFKKKFDNEEKTVDMSVLPPCKTVLRLHCDRAQYLAALWKRATTAEVSYPNPVYYGWNSDKSIMWVDEVFPEEIQLILLDERYDPSEGVGAHGESDEEELLK